MEFKIIDKHISERRQLFLREAATRLEIGIKAGIVPNSVFIDAKDVINRAIEEAAEAFLQTGPHEAKRHQSDWWLGAYRSDAFVRGAHGVPAALKRAQKAKGLKEYVAFIEATLLPLANLLATAKPLIVKKQDLPKVKTARELEREAKTMTCQCCGRAHLANTGVIAHHGYTRPGYGWQTASCYGARALPWEVSRDRLGEMIDHLKKRRQDIRAWLRNVRDEKMALTVRYTDYTAPKVWSALQKANVYPTVAVKVTRKTFAKVAKEHKAKWMRSCPFTAFDQIKASELSDISLKLKAITEDINASQSRFDGWVQTHTGFNKATENWISK